MSIREIVIKNLKVDENTYVKIKDNWLVNEYWELRWYAPSPQVAQYGWNKWHWYDDIKTIPINHMFRLIEIVLQ